jgi:hypothetical protein
MSAPALDMLRAGLMASKPKPVKRTYTWLALASALTIRRQVNDEAWEEFTGVVNPSTSRVWLVYSTKLKRLLYGRNGTANGQYSDDKGETWTAVTFPASFNQIIYVPELDYYYAVATTSAVYRSRDGITWTTLGTVARAYLYLAYAPDLGTGSGRLLVMGSQYIRYCDNADVATSGSATWSTEVASSNTSMNGVDYSPYYGLFFISRLATSATIMKTDGTANPTVVAAGQTAAGIRVAVDFLGVSPATDRILTWPSNTQQGNHNTNAAADTYGQNTGVGVIVIQLLAQKELGRTLMIPSASNVLRISTNGTAYSNYSAGPAAAAYAGGGHHYGV